MKICITAEETFVYQRIVEIPDDEYHKVWESGDHIEPDSEEARIWSYHLYQFAKKYLGRNKLGVISKSTNGIGNIQIHVL